MKTLMINDLSVTEELDHEAMAGVQGGRMKIPGQRASGPLLLSPDGDPVLVVVDGFVVNSVTTG